MISSEWQKDRLAYARLQRKIKAIEAERDDICRNCQYWRDGHCGNPVNSIAVGHGQYNWEFVAAPRTEATQGCGGFKGGPRPTIRPPNPAVREATERYEAERKAREDGARVRSKIHRDSLELQLMNRVGPLKDIKRLDLEELERLAKAAGIDVNS